MKYLAPFLLFIAVVASSFAAGYLFADRDHAIERARIEREAAERAETERKAAAKAADALRLQFGALTDQFNNLGKAFHELRQRVPLVVHRPARAVAACRSVDVPAAPQGAAGPAASAPAEPVQEVAPLELGGLTAGAVWMWNSALFGRDMPSGACGAADTSEAACAVDSGIPIERAWANHETNAKQSAEDTLRHDRLIDYLEDRERRRANVR